MNLKRYALLAALYNPQALPEFDELMAEVNDLAGELLALENSAYRGPGLDAQAASAPAMETKRRWDAAVDWLVQVNSSLVYAITQAFHAALPSRFERGLISQDSLLGTGTAWRAILRVYVDIKSVFRQHCLPFTIQEQFANLPSVWKDELLTYQATRKLPLSVHEKGTDPREKGMSPKVVHFSSRLGFGESVTAVTCPSQTLQTCDSAQWSLVTVTHEMLHSHVRDLFAAIFTRLDEKGQPLSFDDSARLAIDDYDKFKAGQSDANANLLVSLRFLLIEYALDYRGCLEKLNQRYFPSASAPVEVAEEEEVDVLLPNRAKTLTAFRKAHRFTEEVIIHVLDLFYFYRGDSALFVDSLWNTWATVPSIVNKLNWYILRTVLAVSSLYEGGAFERLDFAVKVMIDRLKRMKELGRGTEITDEVINRIEQPGQFKTWLEMLFPPSLKIVDLTSNILRSEKIEAALFSHGDKLVQFDNDQLEYLLETESFDEGGVKSPVAFIFDRMRKAAASKEIVDPIASARRACWVLFAASSQPQAESE